MAKYKVLQEVEVLGEVRAVGSEIEVDEETGAALVAEGKVEHVPAASDPAPAGGEAGTPPAEPAANPAPAPETPPNAGNPADGEKGWAGGHTVGSAEEANKQQGGLRESGVNPKQ